MAAACKVAMINSADIAPPSGDNIMLRQVSRNYGGYLAFASRKQPDRSPPAHAASAPPQQGIDLDVLSKRRRFAFVDGLSMLFLSGPGTAEMATADGEASVALTNSRVENLGRVLIAAAEPLLRVGGRPGRVIVAVDQLDLLLAASDDDDEELAALGDMLLDLQEVGV